MQIKGIKPYPKQKEVLLSILKGEEKYHTVLASRQVGKSILMMNLMLYYAINNEKARILFVSPVYSQISKVLQQIVEALQPTGIIKKANLSDYEIRLTNGSVMWFRSAERSDSIRGLSIQYLFIDEAGDVKTTDFQTSILPTITAMGKKVIIAGTPKKKNFLHSYYMMGQSEDFPNHKSYHFTAEESPFISKEFLEEQRRTLPDAIYKQEFMAEYQDNDGQVFQSLDRVCILNEWLKPNGRVFAGLDVGTKDDYTVLTMMDENGRVVHIWRERHLTYSKIVEMVVSKCKAWNVVGLTIETNSIGDVIYETISKQLKGVEPFITTNQSKELMIRRLIGDIQDAALELPSPNLIPELYNELEAYEYVLLPSGAIRYTHPSGWHDDMVDSLAICNWKRINAGKTKGKLVISSLR